MVIYILSKIWRHGGEIYRDKSDGQLVLDKADKVPGDVLKAAEANFNNIDLYYKSVEGMNAVDLTNWKIIMFMCGWLKNEAIEKFLNNDDQAGLIAFDYQAKLAANGWKDVFDDYRQYETDKSKEIKIELYNRAVAFGKKVK